MFLSWAAGLSRWPWLLERIYLTSLSSELSMHYIPRSRLFPESHLLSQKEKREISWVWGAGLCSSICHISGISTMVTTVLSSQWSWAILDHPRTKDTVTLSCGHVLSLQSRVRLHLMGYSPHGSSAPRIILWQDNDWNGLPFPSFFGRWIVFTTGTMEARILS